MLVRESSGARGTSGFSLVELLITLTIVGILLAVGVPSFNDWITNLRLRGTADGIQNGLQLARNFALQRNSAVRFQLVDQLSSSCVLSTNGENWIISLDDPTGLCDEPPSDTVAPRVLQTKPGAEGNSQATINANQSSVVFNGLGRVTPPPAANITIQVSKPSHGLCVAAGGPVRCLNIVVTAGGQIRMCDPALAATDPQGC